MPKVQPLVLVLIRTLVQHPIKTIVSILMMCGLFCIGIVNFDINPSHRDYLGKDMPLVKHLIELEQEYIEDNNIFIMIKPKTGSVFTPQTLSAIEALTLAVGELPYVKRVDSLSNFQHTSADDDDLIVENLIDNAIDFLPEDIDRVKKIALTDPRLLNFIIASDGNSTGLNISFNIDLANTPQRQNIYLYLEKIYQQFEKDYPGISLYESGYVSLTEHFYRGARYDVSHVFSISLIIIFGGLIFFLRSFRATLAIMLTSMLSVAMALGLYGTLGITLNPASVLAILMVLVLGLADGIHITKSMRRLLAEGNNYKDSVIAATTTNFIPVALTSLTTAIGFFTFNFAGYKGLAHMGNFVAFGVIVAFFLSITLLPTLLLFCNLKPEVNQRYSQAHLWLANTVIKYWKFFLLFTAPTVLISIYFISFNEFDDRMTRYLRSDTVFSRNMEAIQKDLTGITSIIYNFRSGEKNGVSNPDFISKVDAYTQWARQQPEVRQVSSISDTLKTLNQNLHGDDSNFYRVPKDKNLAAQYLLLYEMSLPYGLELTNQINFDKSATRVVLITNDMSYTQANVFLNRSKQWLADNAPEFDPIANSNLLSGLLMAEESIRINIISAMGALAIIGLVLLFAFRSLYAGLICVISVVSPILVTYGLWGITVGVVNLPAALAVCMVIGIAVDFSVHFISKFVHANRELRYNRDDSIRYAFKLVSAPIITSVMVLGGGFLILVLSVFKFNTVMGQLTAMCILFSSLSTFLLVPSILLSTKTDLSLKKK